MLQDKTIQEREMNLLLINEVVAYSESSMCRSKFLLHYFGENYEQQDCGKCDNCLNPKKPEEGNMFTPRSREGELFNATPPLFPKLRIVLSPRS